jgi:hypothetical protein
MLGLSPHEGIATPMSSVDVRGRHFVNNLDAEGNKLITVVAFPGRLYHSHF